MAFPVNPRSRLGTEAAVSAHVKPSGTMGCPSWDWPGKLSVQAEEVLRLLGAESPLATLLLAPWMAPHSLLLSAGSLWALNVLSVSSYHRHLPKGSTRYVLSKCFRKVGGGREERNKGGLHVQQFSGTVLSLTNHVRQGGRVFVLVLSSSWNPTFPRIVSRPSRQMPGEPPSLKTGLPQTNVSSSEGQFFLRCPLIPTSGACKTSTWRSNLTCYLFLYDSRTKTAFYMF